MLVITRKSGQAIVIGSAVVKIVKAKNGRVTVAIEAPREINIRRGELPEKEAA